MKRKKISAHISTSDVGLLSLTKIQCIDSRDVEFAPGAERGDSREPATQHTVSTRISFSATTVRFESDSVTIRYVPTRLVDVSRFAPQNTLHRTLEPRHKSPQPTLKTPKTAEFSNRIPRVETRARASWCVARLGGATAPRPGAAYDSQDVTQPTRAAPQNECFFLSFARGERGFRARASEVRGVSLAPSHTPRERTTQTGVSSPPGSSRREGGHFVTISSLRKTARHARFETPFVGRHRGLSQEGRDQVRRDLRSRAQVSLSLFEGENTCEGRERERE